MERQRIVEQIGELEQQLASLRRELAAVDESSRPGPAAPRVNHHSRSVEYGGACCQVRSRQLLRLFERLLKRPDWYVTLTDLRAAAWGPNVVVSDEAVRQGVCRLKRLLRSAGMGDLAAAFDGSVSKAYRLVPVWRSGNVTTMSQPGHCAVTG